MSWRVAAMLCVALVSPALAQPRLGGGTLGGGGLSGAMQSRGTLIHFLLLEQPSVQQELKASADQVQRARQAGESQRQTLDGLSSLPREEAAKKLIEAQQSADKQLQSILSPEQFRRLKEIGLQQIGPLALARGDVADAVGLAADQQQTIRTLQEQLLQTVTQSVQRSQPAAGGRPKLREVKAKIAGLNESVARVQAAKKDTEGKILGLLTAEQKTKWSQLQGVRFQGQLNLGPLGGRLLGP
jgi:hypothetical protein